MSTIFKTKLRVHAKGHAKGPQKGTKFMTVKTSELRPHPAPFRREVGKRN